MAELNAHTSGPADGPPILAHPRRHRARAALRPRRPRGAARTPRRRRRPARARALDRGCRRGRTEQHVQDLLDTLDAPRLRAGDRRRALVRRPAGHAPRADGAGAGGADGAARPGDRARPRGRGAARRRAAQPAVVGERRRGAGGAARAAAAAGLRGLRRRRARAPQRGADGRFRFRFAPAAAVCAWSEMARPPPRWPAWPSRRCWCARRRPTSSPTRSRRGLRDDLGDAFEVETLDTSHMLYWDAFDDTAATVRRFLRRERCVRQPGWSSGRRSTRRARSSRRSPSAPSAALARAGGLAASGVAIGPRRWLPARLPAGRERRPAHPAAARWRRAARAGGARSCWPATTAARGRSTPGGGRRRPAAAGRGRGRARGSGGLDLGLSPLTNSMPVLRHGLLEGGERDFLMAWVSVPDLAVHADPQRYTFVRATAGGRRLVRFRPERTGSRPTSPSTPTASSSTTRSSRGGCPPRSARRPRAAAARRAPAAAAG